MCVAYIPYVSSLTFFKWCVFFLHTKIYLQTQNPCQYRMLFIIFSSFSIKNWLIYKFLFMVCEIVDKKNTKRSGCGLESHLEHLSNINIGRWRGHCTPLVMAVHWQASCWGPGAGTACLMAPSCWGCGAGAGGARSLTLTHQSSLSLETWRSEPWVAITGAEMWAGMGLCSGGPPRC